MYSIVIMSCGLSLIFGVLFGLLGRAPHCNKEIEAIFVNTEKIGFGIFSLYKGIFQYETKGELLFIHSLLSITKKGAQKYKPGQKVILYMDSNNPSDAVVNKGFDRYGIFLSILGTLIAIFGFSIPYIIYFVQK